MIGAQGSPYLEPDHWQFTFGWRYQYSDRHFTGTHQDSQRDAQNTQVKNTIHQLLFSFQYGWSDQTSLAFNLPYFIGKRSQGAGSSFPGERRYTAAHGIGDASIVARRWVFDVHDHTDGNLGLGLGIQAPTGDDNVQDSIKRKEDTDANNSLETVLRSQTVDQSIQPGSGGWGIITELEAFQSFGIFTPYAFGSWTFTPQGENGVYTGRSKQGETVMSIPDSYIFKLGSMMAVPGVEGFSFGLGARMEGQPAHDPIGKDHGFRRPGYAVSVEPQFVFARGRDVFSFSVPYALVRNRLRSDADQRYGGHGDAAFADYLLLFSWSRRF